MEESADIQFQPITQGLGFHPFSDGLPYAPTRKTPNGPASTSAPAPATPAPLSRGSGAISAGPPIFVKPSAAPAVAPGLVPARESRVPTPQAARTATPSRVPAPAATTTAAPETTPRLGMGYLFRRLVAFTFDVSFQSALGGIILWSAVQSRDFKLELLSSPSVVFVLALFALLLNWLLLAFQEVGFKTSLGKKLLGLHLHGSAGSLFVRSFFFLPSLGFLGLGVLWTLVDRRKRGWHDWIADVQPLPKAPR